MAREWVQRVLQQHKITTYTEKQKSIGNFKKVEKQKNKLNEKGVVYMIPCQQCEKSYIGQTSRPLKTRIAEHEYAIKKRNMNNSIARHNILEGHNPNFTGAAILTKEKNQRTREQKENWFISKNDTRIINHLGIENKQIRDWIKIVEDKTKKVHRKQEHDRQKGVQQARNRN